MQLTKVIVFAAVALGGVVEGANIFHRPSGCHIRKDRIGKSCVLHGASFRSAAEDFCRTFFSYKNEQGTYIAKGQSIGAKMPHVADGKGDEQLFWGNIQVERGTTLVTIPKCEAYMDKIYRMCGGYGGWIDTSFGTVYGECIATA